MANGEERKDENGRREGVGRQAGGESGDAGGEGRQVRPNWGLFCVVLVVTKQASLSQSILLKMEPQNRKRHPKVVQGT